MAILHNLLRVIHDYGKFAYTQVPESFTDTLKIRIIFHIGQYAQRTSATNPVLIHETYDYVFDAVPMFLALASLNIFHPGRILRGPESKFQKLNRAEKKERKRMAKIEKKRRKLGKLRNENEADEGFQRGFMSENSDGNREAASWLSAPP